MYVVTCDESSTNNLASYNYKVLQTLLRNFNYNHNSNLDYIKSIYFSECNESNINSSLSDKQCGDYNECRSDLFFGNNNISCSSYDGFRNLFCEESHACMYTIIDGINTANYNYSSNIYGRGMYSIMGTTSRNFNFMMLNAEKSGHILTAINGTYIACLAEISCDYVKFTSIKNVYAGGYRAIYSSNIYSGGHRLYLDEYEHNSGDDDDDGDKPFWDEYANEPAYVIILVSLILGFNMVVVGSFRLLYKLHKNKISLYSKNKPFEAAFGALFFIFINSIAQIASCVISKFSKYYIQ